MTFRRPIATTALLALAAGITPGRALAEPATQPSGVDVREWVVFVADPQGHLNARMAYPSTLPPAVSSRRATADPVAAKHPQPVGVIRLFGQLDSRSPIDVLLTPPGGEVEASWPRGQTKPGRVLWSNLVPADPAKAPTALDGDNWLTPLRSGDALKFGVSDQTDSFLLYDIAFNYKAPLTLKVSGDHLLIANTGATPMHEVTLYKKRDGQWTTATLATLDPLNPPPPAPAKPTTGKADPAAALDAEPASQPTTQATTTAALPPSRSVAATQHAATRPATTQPSSKLATTTPATKPADRGTAVTLSPAAGEGPALIAQWKPTLAEAGVPASDEAVIEHILADRGLDDRWLTVVYRMDPAELDKLMPLEVVPPPRSITRVGLVIVKGLDPAIDDEIDHLIAECGDPDYHKRKSATEQLIALGPAAKTKLTKAQNNPDVEIAQRVETIIAAIDKQQQQN